MNKTVIRIVIFLSGISLVGIVALQFVWFRKMLEMRENQFDRDVKSALSETTRRLERDQTLFYVSDRLRVLAMADTLLASTRNAMQTPVENPAPAHTVRKADSLIVSGPPSTLSIRKQFWQQFGNQPSVFFYSESSMDSLLTSVEIEIPPFYFLNEEVIREPVVVEEVPVRPRDRSSKRKEREELRKHSPGKDYYEAIVERQKALYNNQLREMKQLEEESRRMMQELGPFGNGLRRVKPPRPEDSPGYKAMSKKIKTLENQTSQMNEALNRLVLEIRQLQTPAQARLDIPSTYQILKQELTHRNISLPFEYAITSVNSDTLARSEGYTPQEKIPTYEARFFSDKFFQTGDSISLYFPGRSNQLLRSMLWLILASVLFTLSIVATFIISILVILRQKKISEIKSDFINNMTHEFKTPIATISLAADTLVNPRIIGDQEKIQYYTRVIKEENKRMNTQVESVLQMAMLEKKDFGLNLQPLDVHDLINQAIQNIAIQIDKRGGKLQARLEAEYSTARVDEIHFLNVMFNLLDNANKYSPDTPEILVSTYNHQQNLFISVKDHGMGMDRETRNRIFEKFFRKSTGNIHNVKGFGLGLSYVKAIVTACGGIIRVESEPGRGSEFIIELPFNTPKDE